MKIPTGLCLGYPAICFALTLAPFASAVAGLAQNTSTYEPYQAVHSRYSAAHVDRFLSHLAAYDIHEARLQTPRFDSAGHLVVPHVDQGMFTRWVQRAAVFNTTYGTHLTITAVFNGAVGTEEGELDLDNPRTRAKMLAGIKTILSRGIKSIHLDLEPYPVTPGFLDLLSEINAAFAELGIDGRVSVVAPGYAYRWEPSYLQQISRLVTEIDPLYYDSGISNPAKYEDWIERSLRYYTANAVATASIVPIIPSYSRNHYHSPAAENIEHATLALANALSEGSRVDGVGIWWWYGFFYDEGGRYDASADRAAWKSTTVHLFRDFSERGVREAGE